MIAVVFREHPLHTVRSGWVRVDPLVVDTPAEERSDDGEVRPVGVGRGRREGVVLVVDPFPQVLGVPPAVNDGQLFEVPDLPVVL